MARKKHDSIQSALWKQQMKEDKRGYVHPLHEDKDK